MIDSIIEILPHAPRCNIEARTRDRPAPGIPTKCNCLRRKQVTEVRAWYEAAQLLPKVWALPAEYGLTVGEILGGRDENDEICEAVEKLITTRGHSQ